MGRWMPLAVREGGTVPTIAMSPNFDEDRTVFAATNTGLFRSRDGGKSWEISGRGLRTFAVHSIALSPSCKVNRSMWVGAADGGVYHSTDGGDNWTLLSRLGRGSAVISLSIVIAPGNTTFLAATLTDGVFISTDKGHSWKPRSSGLPDLSIIAMAISPAFVQDRTAFVAIETGLYRTTDAGNSWHRVLACEPEDAVQCIAIPSDYQSQHTILVGTENSGVLISHDGGNSWQPTNNGLPSLCVNALALSPDYRYSRLLAAATNGGIALSNDGGSSWRLVGGGSKTVMSVDLSGAENRVILAGLFSEGILRSEDGGNSWSSANHGLAANYLIGLALSPVFDTDSILFAWGPSEGILRSGDGGQTWQSSTSGLEGYTPLSLAISPSFATDSELLAGTASGLYRSTDKGQSWQQLSLERAEVNFISFSPAYGKDRTIAVCAGKAIHWSSDGGNSWSLVEQPYDGELITAIALAIDPRGQKTLLVGSWREPTAELRGRLRICSCTLPGTTWTLRFSTYTSTSITTLGVPDSFAQNELFFVGNADCVYRSLPGATERTREGVLPMWLPAGVGSRGYPIVSLAAAPNFLRTRILVAAAGDGVFVSNDEGVRWQRLGKTLGDRSPIAVALPPNYEQSRIVYALTIGGQLWMWDPIG